jgi:hypothetical protein
MKKLLLAYALLSLVILASLSILSYGSGAGYVYMLWRGIQIQTNLWFIAFFIIFISFVLQISWVLFKRYIAHQKRKKYELTSFDELHSYEQLGVAWFLEGEALKTEIIQPAFEKSALLKTLIESRILFRQGEFDRALQILQDSPASVFELAEIQRIEIHLAKQDAQQALTHLEFLSGHALSAWLAPVETLFKVRMEKLWGKFAIQYPWNYLHAAELGKININAKQRWLSQLLAQFEQASVEDLQLLQNQYAERHQHLDELDFDTRLLWLKILSRIPDLAEQHGQLALHLLNERFDQDVFYLWFQQQLLKQNPDYVDIENHINQLESKYLALPIFAFTRWHIYQATQREAEADQLLSLFPDNILMNYLRIKSTLSGDELLIQQLNSVFEQDMKFIQVKI